MIPEEHREIMVRNLRRAGYSEAAAQEFADKLIAGPEREQLAELRDYVEYLRLYICDLANRTDISSVPYSLEKWRESLPAQAARIPAPETKI